MQTHGAGGGRGEEMGLLASERRGREGGRDRDTHTHREREREIEREIEGLMKPQHKKRLFACVRHEGRGATCEVDSISNQRHLDSEM
jgi:hypothetical protein